MQRLFRLEFKLLLVLAAVIVSASYLPAQTVQPRQFVFPQLAIGGGWSFEVYASNQGFASASNLDISFYNDSGNPLTVNSNLGNGASLRFSLNPGAMQVVTVTGSGTVQTGYAVLQVPAGSLVRATLVVRFEQSGQLVTQLGVAPQVPANHFSFAAQVDIARGINTGMALAFPLSSTGIVTTQELTVTLLESDGRVRDAAPLRLSPWGHTALFLNDSRLFPGLDNFQGAVSISGAFPFSVIGLRVEQGILASLAINEGPMLRAFVVSAASRAETEPNNFTSQANPLTLPALISGSIGTPGDTDIYSFSGKQGDNVSAMVETQTTTSTLDSKLALVGFSTVTENDQNGLIGQNDSFIQAVLPSDGTYYLRVTDAGLKGGSEFRYQLHVNITPRVIPKIDVLAPNSGTLGATVNLVITGSSLRRATAVQFSPSSSITVSNLQASDTQVTATVNISSSALTGSRQVLVVTPTANSNSLPFSVNAPVRIDSLTPNNGLTGTTVNLTIRGSNLSGATKLNFEPAGGITVNNLQSSSSFQVTAALVIAPDAAVGARQLTVSTSTGTSNALPFDIKIPVVIDSITPNNGEKGKTINIVILGTNLSGATRINFDPSFSITISNLQSSDSQVTASVAISEFASGGVRQVSVTTAAGVSNRLPFTILDPLRLTSISPFRAAPGATLNLTLRGTRLSGTTAIDFTPAEGLTVGNIQSTDTQITAQLTVAADAFLGGRSVTVTTAAGVAGPLLFSITGPTGAANAPVVSNLKVNTPVGTLGNPVTVSGSFDFTDPNGDIFFNGGRDGSAQVIFRITAGTFSCTLSATGDFLNKLGETSGSVQFQFTFNPGSVTFSTGTLPVSFTLTDAAGNASATVTFQTPVWFCGIQDDNRLPEADSIWMIGRRRRLV